MNAQELLEKIHRLEIKTKGLTKHIFSGEYHSAFKGRGMAFSEVRNYQIGDEIRTIDWNVTARFNDPHVKVFEEERELTVMLLVDVSSSGDFGSTERTKKDLLLETMAVLAFSALSNNDKVGVLFISDEVERYIPPKKGRKHILYLLREFIAFQPKNKGTNLNNGLKFFRNTHKKRTICFVVSDFIDDSHFIEGLKITHKSHDVIALLLEDPSEYELPKMGFVQLFNAETGDTTWVNSNDSEVREAFKTDFKEKQQKLLKDFTRNGIDFAVLNTGEDYIVQLVNLFRNR
ncbi:MAG: DUF58 domain-containing protein [Crocinitomicaceae bacterium]|nr:DUF58 domain-containing protein [Crocinitomicaceae bacterium]